MSEFIKLRERDYGFTIFININQIAMIWENGGIVIAGNHAEGNGLIKLTKESHEKLLAVIKERIIND